MEQFELFGPLEGASWTENREGRLVSVPGDRLQRFLVLLSFPLNRERANRALVIVL